MEAHVTKLVPNILVSHIKRSANMWMLGKSALIGQLAVTVKSFVTAALKGKQRSEIYNLVQMSFMSGGEARLWSESGEEYGNDWCQRWRREETRGEEGRWQLIYDRVLIHSAHANDRGQVSQFSHTIKQSQLLFLQKQAQTRTNSPLRRVIRISSSIQIPSALREREAKILA